MYQRITIVGNLGRDPDLRYLPNGTPTCHFPVAVNQKWTTSSGEAKEQTVWFQVTVFGRTAETSNEYLMKGSKVLVEGTLTCDEKTGGPRIWTRRDGTPSASFEVRSNTVRFLSRPSESERAGGQTDPETVAETAEELPF